MKYKLIGITAAIVALLGVIAIAAVDKWKALDERRQSVIRNG